MGWWLTIFVAGAALGALQIGVGLLIGRWLAGREEPAAEPAEPAEAEGIRAWQFVLRLGQLASGVAEDVGEHRARMLKAKEELASIPRTEGTDVTQVVLGTVAKILQVNERLQDRLITAEEKLREQAQQIESQVAAARTDSLTGLPNRRAFDDELARAIALWHRRQVAACLMILDVDHFKAFNDRHGHPAGDQVLRGVAEVLRDALRDMDLVSRIGGEEFAVILPNTNAHEAKRMAERVRGLVASSRYSFEKSSLSVTVSVGLAMVEAGDDTLSMIKRADEALYASKRAGRNCGYFHTEHMCKRIEVPTEPGQPSRPTHQEPEPSSSGDEPAAIQERASAAPTVNRGAPSGAHDEADLERICEDLRLRLAEVGERPGQV